MGFFQFLTGSPSLEEGLAKMEKNGVLLDVRTPGEYQSGHLPGAINIPLDQIQSAQLPQGRPLYVYCRSGARSGQACQWLRSAGYQAENLGGLMGYRGKLER